MNLNLSALFRGLTKKTEQPIVCVSSQAGRAPEFDSDPSSGYFLSSRSGLLSTGALLGSLDNLARVYPQAKADVELLGDVIMQSSINCQFDPKRVEIHFTTHQKEALNRVTALSKHVPATNVVRQPIKNLSVATYEGIEIDIRTNEGLPAVGDQVFVDAQPAPDGVYTISADGRKLTVKGGKITQIQVADAPEQPVASAAMKAQADFEAQAKKNEADYQKILASIKAIAPNAVAQHTKPAEPANPLAAAIAAMKAQAKAGRKESEEINALVARNLATRRLKSNQ